MPSSVAWPLPSFCNWFWASPAHRMVQAGESIGFWMAESLRLLTSLRTIASSVAGDSKHSAIAQCYRSSTGVQSTCRLPKLDRDTGRAVGIERRWSAMSLVLALLGAAVLATNAIHAPTG